MSGCEMFIRMISAFKVDSGPKTVRLDVMDIRHIDSPNKTITPNVAEELAPEFGWAQPEIIEIIKRGPMVSARVKWKAAPNEAGVFSFDSKRWREYTKVIPLPYLFAIDEQGKHVNLWMKYEC